jgi:hypothetical protein
MSGSAAPLGERGMQRRLRVPPPPGALKRLVHIVRLLVFGTGPCPRLVFPYICGDRRQGMRMKAQARWGKERGMLEEMEQGEREESERRETRESTSSSELSEESLSSAAAVTSALSLSVCPSPR